jgi:hypothetical protein
VQVFSLQRKKFRHSCSRFKSDDDRKRIADACECSDGIARSLRCSVRCDASLPEELYFEIQKSRFEVVMRRARPPMARWRASTR